MAELDTRQSSAMGMRTEQLTGRTQEVFFSAEESGNLTYPWAPQAVSYTHLTLPTILRV